MAPTFPDLEHLPKISEQWVTVILARAKQLDIKAAETAVAVVRAMLGNPVAVQRAWTLWCQTAPEMIEKANQNIGTLITDVDGYWDGDAKGAFSSYLSTGDNSVEKSVTNTVTALTAVGESFGELYKGIIDTYKSCVKAMSDCAATLLELGGDVADAVGSNVGDNGNPTKAGPLGAESKMTGQLAKAAAQALAKFAKTVGDLEEQALDTMGGNMKALMDMKNDVTKVLAPDDIPDVLSDPEKFYPKPR